MCDVEFAVGVRWPRHGIGRHSDTCIAANVKVASASDSLKRGPHRSKIKEKSAAIAARSCVILLHYTVYKVELTAATLVKRVRLPLRFKRELSPGAFPDWTVTTVWHWQWKAAQ